MRAEARDDEGSEVNRKSGALCCGRKGRAQQRMRTWGEEWGAEREGGVALGLSVSGACGNAASPN